MTIYHWNYQLATSNESPHLAEWLYLRFQALVREYLKRCIAGSPPVSLPEINSLLQRFYGYSRQLVKYFAYIDRYYVARNAVSSLRVVANETVLTFLLQAHEKDIQSAIEATLTARMASPCLDESLRAFIQTAFDIYQSVGQPQSYTNLATVIATMFRSVFEADQLRLQAGCEGVADLVEGMLHYWGRVELLVR
jgi:hypothetical protein